MVLKAFLHLTLPIRLTGSFVFEEGTFVIGLPFTSNFIFIYPLSLKKALLLLSPALHQILYSNHLRLVGSFCHYASLYIKFYFQILIGKEA